MELCGWLVGEGHTNVTAFVVCLIVLPTLLPLTSMHITLQALHQHVKKTSLLENVFGVSRYPFAVSFSHAYLDSLWPCKVRVCFA